MIERDPIATRDVGLMRMDPQALIARAIDAGSGIETMERLVALAKDVRAEQAREAWYSAMSEFQRQCPSVLKTSAAKIQTARAAYSYRWASLDEIASTIQPVMGELGLSIAWRHRVEPAQVVVSCRVSHALGHVEDSGEVAMPIVQGDGTGASPQQRVGVALTYAKRYALLGVTGIAPADPDDTDAASPEPPGDPAPTERSGNGRDAASVITEPQMKRLSAIASG